MIKAFTNLILAFAEESSHNELGYCLANNTYARPYDQSSHIMITSIAEGARNKEA